MPRGENLQPGNMNKQLQHGKIFREVLELADGGDPEAKRRVKKMRREAKVRQKARPGMKATLQAATRQSLQNVDVDEKVLLICYQTFIIGKT